MQPEKQGPLTFIIRLWREKNDGKTDWRGSVDHVQSGERVYFQAISSLLEIITRKADDSSLEDDQ
jgi:hypothetical protein